LRPSLWSSGQSFWLQIQRSGFDSRRYQIFWEAVGLKRGPLSLVSTIEELLGKNSSGSSLEIREYGCRDSSRWPCVTLYLQKMALTSPTSSIHLVGIVLLQTKATELLLHNNWTWNQKTVLHIKEMLIMQARKRIDWLAELWVSVLENCGKWSVN
jgi:hypothetical protein